MAFWQSSLSKTYTLLCTYLQEAVNNNYNFQITFHLNAFTGIIYIGNWHYCALKTKVAMMVQTYYLASAGLEFGWGGHVSTKQGTQGAEYTNFQKDR